MPRASVSESKIPSGPSPRGEEGVRTRIPSAPAPSRHRIPDRRGPPAPLLPPRCFLLGERNTSERPLFFNEACSSKRRSTSPPLFPENLRPSTRHRDSMLPSILTSKKQRVSKTTKQGANKTMGQHNRGSAKQHNSKTIKQEGHEFKTPRLLDVSTDVSHSVSTECSQSVLKSVSQTLFRDFSILRGCSF